MVKVEQKRIIKKVGAQTYIWVLLLLMYLPVLTLIIFSFTPSVNLGTWSGFSFDLYVALFNDKEIMTAVGNTIILAVTSSLCSVILGTLGAIGAYNLKSKSRRSVEMVTQIPIVNPEIVMALSLTIMFVFIGNYIFKGFTMSFWTLLIGHIVLSLPFEAIDLDAHVARGSGDDAHSAFHVIGIQVRHLVLSDLLQLVYSDRSGNLLLVAACLLDLGSLLQQNGSRSRLQYEIK